jgi:hypothetical protein
MDNAEIILYADDTVIYYAHKDPKMIQETLENHCNTIHVCMYVCELYLPTVDLSGFYMKDDNRIQ